MISVKVKPYCKDCPDFVAEVDSYSVVVNNLSCPSGKTICNHTIQCKNRERCAALEKHIKESLKEKKENK